MKLDVRDRENIWCQAEVIRVEESHSNLKTLLIHYIVTNFKFRKIILEYIKLGMEQYL